MIKLLFASHNKNKAKEINALLGKKYEVLTLDDIGFVEEIEETGAKFFENALIKAKAGFESSGIPCFADDSGLEVEALNGAPGIYSARYAGIPKDDSKNLNLLLQNLKQETNRAARFVTVICFFTSSDVHFFEGECKGNIIHQAKGKGGFGYDPVFVPSGHDLTFAEMSDEAKNKISHRARAIVKFQIFLSSLPSL